VNSALVTGQNYYTAITRARYGVKLWTEDSRRLVEKLERRSGEKTSSLEGLGRLDRDSHRGRLPRHGERWEQLRARQREDREARRERMVQEAQPPARGPLVSIAHGLAGRAQTVLQMLDHYLEQVLSRGQGAGVAQPDRDHNQATPPHQPERPAGPDH